MRRCVIPGAVPGPETEPANMTITITTLAQFYALESRLCDEFTARRQANRAAGRRGDYASWDSTESREEFIVGGRKFEALARNQGNGRDCRAFCSFKLEGKRTNRETVLAAIAVIELPLEAAATAQEPATLDEVTVTLTLSMRELELLAAAASREVERTKMVLVSTYSPDPAVTARWNAQHDAAVALYRRLIAAHAGQEG